MLNAEIGAQSALGIGGVLFNAYQISQSHSMHTAETSRAEHLHAESTNLAKEQHTRDILMVKQTYLMDVFINLKQHFQQLNADLISSAKESERDMFDQRNQQFQTIILSSSVMFSALSTVIIQGFLPKSSGTFLFVSYALSSALSFSFLFISIVLCIEIISRASKFMYEKASQQSKSLRVAIQESKENMLKIRSNSQLAQNIGKVVQEDFDVDSEWNKHELTVYDFLRKREEINLKAYQCDNGEYVSANSAKDVVGEGESTPRDSRGAGGGGGVGVGCDREMRRQSTLFGKKSFEEYWEKRCKRWGETAILCFYLGSACLLLSIMIFMWAEFSLMYGNVPAAGSAVALIGLSLVCGLGFVSVSKACHPSNCCSRQTTQQEQGPIHGDDGATQSCSSSSGGRVVNVGGSSAPTATGGVGEVELTGIPAVIDTASLRPNLSRSRSHSDSVHSRSRSLPTVYQGDDESKSVEDEHSTSTLSSDPARGRVEVVR